MDYAEERAKPLYMIRTPSLHNSSERQRFAALASELAIETAGEGLHMVKAAAINSMPQLLNAVIPVANSAVEKALIIARLKAVPEKHYRFVDGSDFTGAQAAQEIEHGTEKGRYFIRLEEQVLKIARDAKKRGEF